MISSTGGELKNPEVAQAFKWPIWDQNGFMVRYEILVNDEERDYIWKNGLETLNGQVKFSQSGNVVDFPIGIYGKEPVGAIEVKLAWKVLAPSDDESRFLITNAMILGVDGKPKIGQGWPGGDAHCAQDRNIAPVDLVDVLACRQPQGECVGNKSEDGQAAHPALHEPW